MNAAQGLRRIRALVDEQAEDEGLWALPLPPDAQPIMEAYLQQELRRLHGLIEEVTEVPQQRAEATTASEGAEGWVDQAGSAQDLAGGHGLDVAPDAQPDRARAEARPPEDRDGGEPSNAPTADEVLVCEFCAREVGDVPCRVEEMGAADAVEEFMCASVMVWREIDKHIDGDGHYRDGVPALLEKDAALRVREREAWERLRGYLDDPDFARYFRLLEHPEARRG